MNQAVTSAINRSGTNLSERPTVKKLTILGILVWLTISLLAGWNDLFSQTDAPPAIFGVFILTPIVSFSVLYALSHQFKAYANSISLSLITIAHVWRFVGMGFIIAVFAGKLPPQFGYPEGLGDIIAAAFAIPIAAALKQSKPIKKYFVAWNVFGLVDLISAITMGLLYSQGSFGILRTDLSTALMTSFPVHLIPTFFVPLFILLHLLALARRHEVGAVSSKQFSKEIK